MRPRLVLLGLACAALSAAAQPAVAQRQRGNESWGKPGTSYLQYRTDAVECAYLVGQQAPVDYPLVNLAFPIDMAGPDAGADLSSYALAMASAYDPNAVRMSREWRTISAQVQPALTQCLTDRGYRRFRLTKDEARRLRDFPGGSRARHVYLWNLSQSAVEAPRR